MPEIKSTLLGLVDVGIHVEGLLSSTSVKIYKSLVLPRALYGSELWSDIGKTLVTQIEKAHRFCLKYIQNLPSYTRTNVCLSLAGVKPIEYKIEYRKLLFLGQICRFTTNHIPKKIFNYRLFSFYHFGSSVQLR